MQDEIIWYCSKVTKQQIVEAIKMWLQLYTQETLILNMQGVSYGSF